MSAADPSRERGGQRRMYRELREQASRAQRRRQEKIERLLAQYARSGRRPFRHPSR
jgi:hypothetical protein